MGGPFRSRLFHFSNTSCRVHTSLSHPPGLPNGVLSANQRQIELLGDSEHAVRKSPVS